MKLKVVLTKGFKNNKITKTLNLGDNPHSKTAQSSLKDLNLPTNSNQANTKPYVKSKNKMLQQSNLKAKNSHIEIKAKEKPLIKNKSQIEKNNTVSNVSPYKIINDLQEKKKNYIKKEKTVSHFNLKRYKYNYINNDHNFIDREKKIYYKTPMKIRNISSGHIFDSKKINIDSKVNRQYLNTVYFNNIEKNNNTMIIMNLQKELESLKRENLFKTMLITNMKEQIEQYQKQQQIRHENNLLKEEIELLKNKCNINNDDISLIDNDKKLKNIDLFDKLKYEYLNSQNQVIELKKQNMQLKNNLNNKIYKKSSIIKNISILLGKSNQQVLNNIEQDIQNKIINNYIENKYKLILQNENKDISNYHKSLKEEQKKRSNF